MARCRHSPQSPWSSATPDMVVLRYGRSPIGPAWSDSAPSLRTRQKILTMREKSVRSCPQSWILEMMKMRQSIGQAMVAFRRIDMLLSHSWLWGSTGRHMIAPRTRSVPVPLPSTSMAASIQRPTHSLQEWQRQRIEGLNSVLAMDPYEPRWEWAEAYRVLVLKSVGVCNEREWVFPLASRIPPGVAGETEGNSSTLSEPPDGVE